MHPVRQRLMYPRNAVEDTEINSTPPQGVRGQDGHLTLVPKPTPKEVKIEPKGFLWPGKLSGECWLPYDFPALINAPPRTLKTILHTTASVFEVRVDDLLSHRRTWGIVRPRQAAMALAKHLTFCSYPEIGRRFGGRDHTTVMHAVARMRPYMQAVSDELNADDGVELWVRAMKAKLEEFPLGALEERR